MLLANLTGELAQVFHMSLGDVVTSAQKQQRQLPSGGTLASARAKGGSGCASEEEGMQGSRAARAVRAAGAEEAASLGASPASEPLAAKESAPLTAADYQAGSFFPATADRYGYDAIICNPPYFVGCCAGAAAPGGLRGGSLDGSSEGSGSGTGADRGAGTQLQRPESLRRRSAAQRALARHAGAPVLGLGPDDHLGSRRGARSRSIPASTPTTSTLMTSRSGVSGNALAQGTVRAGLTYSELVRSAAVLLKKPAMGAKAPEVSKAGGGDCGPAGYGPAGDGGHGGELCVVLPVESGEADEFTRLAEGEGLRLVRMSGCCWFGCRECCVSMAMISDGVGWGCVVKHA
jgi:hypothetical protein